MVLYSGDDAEFRQIQSKLKDLKIDTYQDNALQDIQNILKNLGRKQANNEKNNQNFLFKSNKNFGKNSNECLNLKKEQAKNSNGYLEENKKIQKEQGEAEKIYRDKKRKIPILIAEEKKIEEQEEIRRKKKQEEIKNNENYILKLQIQSSIRNTERQQRITISNAERLIMYGNIESKKPRIGDKN